MHIFMFISLLHCRDLSQASEEQCWKMVGTFWLRLTHSKGCWRTQTWFPGQNWVYVQVSIRGIHCVKEVLQRYKYTSFRWLYLVLNIDGVRFNGFNPHIVCSPSQRSLMSSSIASSIASSKSSNLPNKNTKSWDIIVDIIVSFENFLPLSVM